MTNSVPLQSLWAVGTQAIIMLGGIISSVILNRALEPEGRGQVALVLVWPTLFAYLVMAGWTQALSRHVSRNPNHGRKRVGSLGATRRGNLRPSSSPGVVLVPKLLANQPELWAFACCLLVFIPCTILGSLAVAVLEALGRFELTARVRAGVTLANLAALTTLVSLGLLVPPSYLVVFIVTTILVNVYAVFLMSRATIGAWNPVFFNTPFYALCNAPLALSQIVQPRVDQLLVSSLAPSDPAEFGVYVAGATLGTFLSPVALGLSLVILPESSRRSDSGGVHLFGRMARVYLLVAILSALPLAVMAREVLFVAYGPDFLAGAQAVRVSLLNTVLGGVFLLGINALLGMNRPGAATLVGLITCLTSTVCGAVLLSRFGYIGTAYGQAVGWTVGTCFLLLALREVGFAFVALLPGRAELAQLWSLGKKSLLTLGLNRNKSIDSFRNSQ